MRLNNIPTISRTSTQRRTSTTETLCLHLEHCQRTFRSYCDAWEGRVPRGPYRIWSGLVSSGLESRAWSLKRLAQLVLKNVYPEVIRTTMWSLEQAIPTHIIGTQNDSCISFKQSKKNETGRIFRECNPQTRSCYSTC